MERFLLRRTLLRAALAACVACAARAAQPWIAPVKRVVPGTGESITAVGLGTYNVFDVGHDTARRAEARAALQKFAELGGELIDSSPMYGTSETVTGDLAAELGLHPRLFIATKVWTRGRDAGIAQMRDSIARLRSELKGPLDLMQVHNLVDTDVHLATLRNWKREGRVRLLGVTHYHAGAHADLERAIGAGDIDFLQVNYSLAEPQADRRLLEAARANGVAVIVNRPFAEGAMFARIRGKPLPALAGEIGCESWSQLFLKWIISHPAVTCAIPGTRNAAHVADNLAAARDPMPDAATRRRISEMFGKL